MKKISKEKICCKCGSHLLDFEVYRETDFNLVFCAYCKTKLKKFLTSKLRLKKVSISKKENFDKLEIVYYPLTDKEIEKYVMEFVNDN